MIRPLAALLAVALVTGCAPAPTSPTPDPRTAPPATVAPRPAPSADIGGIAVAEVTSRRLPTTPADAASAGDAVNAFGLDLYARLIAADPGADLVVSPASILTALSMARAGARGTTATEMDAVMRAIGADENAEWIAALDQSLNAKTATFQDAQGHQQDVMLRSVNAPFAQAGYPLEHAYLAALAQRFGAGLQLVDFIGDAEASRDAINGWVSDHTADRIKELLAEGTVDDLTRLVLVNAMYLKAAWQVPFDEDLTAPAPFTGLDGTTTDVPMMHVAASFPYASGTGWQAVDLGYVGGGLSMLVIAPDDLAALEKTLDGAALGRITEALANREVQLALPKFGAETHVGLAEVLGAMGMPTAFDPGAADFAGMTAADRLFISAVVHQANIDVDEGGTEAAAATAVVVGRVSASTGEVRMTVDRPFLFALRDLDTGAVLFLGRITEPASRS